MNYRHAFHAGNHADVLKHAVLLLCLASMARKAAPLSLLDTHAGRGLYDLSGEEAQRSPEWQLGAARVFDWAGAPASLHAYQRALHGLNFNNALQYYPGSPWLAAGALRPGDSLALCELHAQECAALRRLVLPDGSLLRARAQIHQRDGYEALRALLPLPHKRALILIDPPYERGDEFAQAASALRAALQRLRGGVFIWWRPLKDTALVDAADNELQAETPLPALRIDLVVRAPSPGASSHGAPSPGGLGGSSLLILNPPFGVQEEVESLLPDLCARLAQGTGAAWRVIRSGAR